MESSLRLRTFSQEEYLEIERKAKYKSEYIEGQIYAMAGASPGHAAINMAVAGLLWMQLRGKPCTVYSNDLKVKISYAGEYYYPDLTIVCGTPLFHDEHKDVLVNPKVIVEVLSPSTEADDRGRKWLRYQQIESLTDYLLVSQSEPFIEHYSRRSDEGWHYESCVGLTGELQIASLDCQLQAADVYEKVSFAA